MAACLRSRGRYIHVSIGQHGKGGEGTRIIGSNALKRANREESIRQRVAARCLR